MSKILWITGAKGFIGRHVALVAAQQGFTVLGVGFGEWSFAEKRQWGLSGWINGEINRTNIQALYQLMGSPSCIIHLAGGSSVGYSFEHPLDDFNRTVQSTVNLLEWIKNNAVESKLVVASSAAVYGVGYQDVIPESAYLNPYSPYGYHKMIMEKLCHSYGENFGIQLLITRLFSVYGAGLKKQLLWDIGNRLILNPKQLILGGSGQEIRDWVHVLDVANALLSLVQNASNSAPTVNIGTGKGTTVHDIAQLFLTCWQEFTGKHVELHFSGESRKGDPVCLIANCHALAKMKHQCIWPIDKGIKEYVGWYLNNVARAN